MKKILAVGLENAVLENIKKNLDVNTLTLVTVNSAQEGLILLNQQKFSMILLSNVLPDLKDYREFCLIVKSADVTSNIPIILFASTREKPDAKLEVLKSSLVSEYFILPVPVEEIMARLNIFIELRLLQEELEAKNVMLTKLAITDDLTKIFNRRHLMDRMIEEIACMKRYKYPVSCILIDIDYFKKINDTYGHLSGDAILSELASVLKKNIRSSDILSRYGGEEFLVLLPFTNKGGVTIVAERLRHFISEHKFSTDKGSLSITLSMGAVSFSCTDTAEPEDIIRIVDEQLYKAKEGGRNRVCVISYEECRPNTISSNRV